MYIICVICVIKRIICDITVFILFIYLLLLFYLEMLKKLSLNNEIGFLLINSDPFVLCFFISFINIVQTYYYIVQEAGVFLLLYY